MLFWRILLEFVFLLILAIFLIVLHYTFLAWLITIALYDKPSRLPSPWPLNCCSAFHSIYLFYQMHSSFCPFLFLCIHLLTHPPITFFFISISSFFLQLFTVPPFYIFFLCFVFPPLLSLLHLFLSSIFFLLSLKSSNPYWTHFPHHLSVVLFFYSFSYFSHFFPPSLPHPTSLLSSSTINSTTNHYHHSIHYRSRQNVRQNLLVISRSIFSHYSLQFFNRIPLLHYQFIWIK